MMYVDTTTAGTEAQGTRKSGRNWCKDLQLQPDWVFGLFLEISFKRAY